VELGRERQTGGQDAELSAPSLGVVLEGELEIETDTGARRILPASEAFEVPPGHNARVIGDEPFVTIEFASVHS
jgi:hypothetical protein